MTTAPEPITSADNPQFKTLRKLAGSGRERRKTGVTLLDGLHLIEAWLAAGHALQKLVASAAGAARPEHARWLAAHPQHRHIVLADTLFAQLVDAEDSPSGLLALVEMPQDGGLPNDHLDTVVLDGVQDPGNVGSILRSAAAAGFRQAVLSADCAQAWSPKVLRAGMGAHFAIRVFEGVDLPGYLVTFKGTVAVTHLAGSTALYDADLDAPLAWVFGSEGQGVRREVLDRATLRVNIPMPGTVESLNVAAAAAVCLFETARRRWS
jgi:RNA methyltransferase, TrmH family